ncbi:hypothetical protein KIH74_13500 [Kineosporia sp. J2-2]|uniref:Uncharacterized protein n=1 Tax=Kineosporia corallincola TaxID=2835133 RepID=A0ABS5TFU1_9ACTN|nr:hypothetical protein [Kineosporia corallincola]MBT0769947.1 hypothetical protein [Kineosporia corallincola]
MRTSSTPGRRPSSRRLWALSLSAVVLAVAGTTVAISSASGQPARHRPPRAAATTPVSTATSTPAATATTQPAATSPATSTSTPEDVSATTSTGSSAGGSAAGTCDRAASSTAQVEVTDVKLPNKVRGYGSEGDTEVLPMAIASVPGGTSWLAWAGTDDRVYLGQLGCDDELTGTPVSFEGIDLQDVQADADGGVLLLTRKGDCGDGPLCGGESSPCNTMHMIRFDNTGAQVWDQQVTNLSDSVQGYDDGARFVWWYQHHGRLATDGENYAAYFGTAITVQNGDCVDIHEGDRMQVVSSTGELVKNQGFEVGCSHAWTSRIVYDPDAKKFVTTCATDNDCRIAQPNPYRTVAASTCDGTLFGGDLVLGQDGGYWTAWSQGNATKLSHFTTGQADQTLNPGAATQHPHLVQYGSDRMLLSWESGSKTSATVLDRSTGKAVGSTLSIDVADHDYMSFKQYDDGSAAYAAAGTDTGSVKIARVLPMT